MNTYQRLSVIFGLLLYLPLGWQLLSGQVTQNPATWLLWGSLDVIAAASMYKQKGNWQLPAAYVGGCTFTLICMKLSGQKSEWTSFETLICGIVFLCIVGWYKSGPRLATILSTVGVVIAGFPQLKDAWVAPEQMPFIIYIGYTFVNYLSTKGGKEWSVEERFYPACCTGLCFAIAGLSAQKFF